METLARLVVTLIVLGFCLPSHAEILVYKLTLSGTYYEFRDGEWSVSNHTYRGYAVMDLNYDESSIAQSGFLVYYSRDGEKRYEEGLSTPELVRVDDGVRTRWVVMDKSVQFDGDEIIGGEFQMMAGNARARGIGVEESREVASKLSGYSLSGVRGSDIVMLKMSLTFYPAWTYWANGEAADEGNQSFEDTMQMIEGYLEAKGYTLHVG